MQGNKKAPTEVGAGRPGRGILAEERFDRAADLLSKRSALEADRPSLDVKIKCAQEDSNPRLLPPQGSALIH